MRVRNLDNRFNEGGSIEVHISFVPIAAAVLYAGIAIASLWPISKMRSKRGLSSNEDIMILISAIFWFIGIPAAMLSRERSPRA